jgi:hypothetical protein
MKGDIVVSMFEYSMMRYIMGITDEERQRRRDQILSTRLDTLICDLPQS